MNVYKFKTSFKCPENGLPIDYSIEIKRGEKLLVEDLVAFCGELVATHQEDFADALFAKFGGKQKIIAHHHGVTIGTVRGES